MKEKKHSMFYEIIMCGLFGKHKWVDYEDGLHCKVCKYYTKKGGTKCK